MTIKVSRANTRKMMGKMSNFDSQMDHIYPILQNSGNELRSLDS